MIWSPVHAPKNHPLEGFHVPGGPETGKMAPSVRTIKVGEESTAKGNGAYPPCPSVSMGHHNHNRGEPLNEDVNKGSITSCGASPKVAHPSTAKSVFRGGCFITTAGGSWGK